MSKTVLVVDDAVFMRRMLTDILEKNGYEVVGEAGDGEEAVELFEEHKPNIVTMDITMPNMDGIEALKEIKKIDPSATVIMCSAMGQQNMVMKALDAGARDFIIKPFQPDAVLEALGKNEG